MSEQDSGKPDSSSDLKVLLDEDTKAKKLVYEFQSSGYDVKTTSDLELDGEPDANVLAAATADGRAVITRNCGDYLTLHESTADHAGILVCYYDDDTMDHTDIVKAVVNIEQAGVPIPGQIHVLNQWNFKKSDPE